MSIKRKFDRQRITQLFNGITFYKECEGAKTITMRLKGLFTSPNIDVVMRLTNACMFMMEGIDKGEAKVVFTGVEFYKDDEDGCF